jgi:hypothetical protein
MVGHQQAAGQGPPAGVDRSTLEIIELEDLRGNGFT